MIAWGALWRKHDAIWDCRAARGGRRTPRPENRQDHLWERRSTDRQAAASWRTRKRAREWKASVFRRGLRAFPILLTRKLSSRHYRTQATSPPGERLL